MKIQDFSNYKLQNRKISMVTCYDYTSARLLQKSKIDCVLVVDSAAMVMGGHNSTLPATVEMMSMLTSWVARGLAGGTQFIVGDLPFLSYRTSLSENMNAVGSLMRSGAHAIKLEGAKGNLELISHITDSGVPVMGHLGLTPQSVHQLGGYRVQGQADAAKELLMSEALALEAAGCFSLVLECIPTQLAQDISQALSIPTIGIGAGVHCDGQVLVWQDMLGLNQDFKPKFVKNYTQLGTLAIKALNQFDLQVKNKKFPTAKESYK